MGLIQPVTTINLDQRETAEANIQVALDRPLANPEFLSKGLRIKRFAQVKLGQYLRQPVNQGIVRR